MVKSRTVTCERDRRAALSKLAATAMTSRLIMRNTDTFSTRTPPALNHFTVTLHSTELKAVQAVVPQSETYMKFSLIQGKLIAKLKKILNTKLCCSYRTSWGIQLSP